MVKKIGWIVSGLLIVLCTTVYLSAQSGQDPKGYQDSPLGPMLQQLDKIQAQLDSVSGKQERQYQEVTVKLDQVLANQQKILDELAIVKVRASRKF